MASSSLAIIVIMLAIVAPNFSFAVISDKLSPDFYQTTCPHAEQIISDVVKKNAAKNGTIPGIIRLHFHDCFITGCDATILLVPEPYNGEDVEMKFPANGASLRGMDVLEEAKAELEKVCPGIVSCADLLAYAAREAVVLAGNPPYAVPAGRRDSIVAKMSPAEGLPKGVESIADLEKKYEERGLNTDDLVVLEGAHSIGRARCGGTIAYPGSMVNVTGSEALMDKKLQAEVKEKYCTGTAEEMMEKVTPFNPEKGDSDWGVSFYNNIMAGKAVLPCDIGMAVDPSTKQLVQDFAKDAKLWATKFSDAMIKLGKVNVLTETGQGEVRKVCSRINSAPN